MDEEKEMKLAAARKKLKRFQKKREEERAKASSNCSREHSPDCQVENSLKSSSSSISSSVTDVSKSASTLDLISEPYNNDGSVNSETISMATVINTKEDKPRSTTESLRQLSLQMSGLVNDSHITECQEPDATVVELEKRNSELAVLLSQEKELTLQYSQMNEELKQRLHLQDSQIESLQNIALSSSGNNTEVNEIREQLQVHVQTIGILVAEKSELQSNLEHMRHSYDLKAGEVTQLQDLLNVSRQRLIEVETSHQDLQDETSTLTNFKELNSQQLQHLQAEHSKSSKVVDELQATVAELRERIAGKTEENEKFLIEVTELKRNLEMAQIHIEQLRDGSQDDIRHRMEEMKESIIISQKKLFESEASLVQAREEKNQIERQYHSYASQLATEIENLKSQLNQESQKCHDLNKQKETLETQLKETSSVHENLLYLQKEREDLVQQVNSLLQEIEVLSQKCSSLDRNNGQLSQLASEQASKLDLLEATIDRTSTQHVNTDQLLESMQSDKVAASRALSQNKQLKEQLEELQNGFVMMSNKKLELTEKLERELYSKKGLMQQISSLTKTVSNYEETMMQLKAQKEPLLNGDVEPVLSEATDPPTTPESPELIMNGDSIIPTVGESVVVTNDCKEVDVSPASDQEIFQVAHEALQKRFTKCMSDLAAMTEEKQQLEHLIQQLQLETETVGDYITIYQFQRGVMKQQMNELSNELDLLRTEKQDTLSKLKKLQKLFNTLAMEASGIDAQNLSKAYAAIIHNDLEAENLQKEKKLEEKDEAEVKSNIATNGEEKEENPVQLSNEELKKTTKSITVRKIIDLIGDMETSSQLDLTALSKFHPCRHCSGSLITI